MILARLRRFTFKLLGLAWFGVGWMILFEKYGLDLFKMDPTREMLQVYFMVCGIFATSGMIFFSTRSLILGGGLYLLYALFPLFGPSFGGALMLALLFQKKLDLLTDFHEEDKALGKGMGPQREVKSYEVSIRENINVEPLVETIRSHVNPDLKRGAIETLTQICSPDSIALLKECLSDPNTEVRFYASSGLSRIEERLNGEIVKYKNILKDPSHVVCTDDYLNLGKAYFEFIYLEIQDQASLAYYLQEAINAFEKAHAEASDSVPVLQALERAYIKAGRNDDARLLKKKHSGKDTNLIYLAESYYDEGQLTKCKEVFDTMGEESTKWEAISNVRDIWVREEKEGSV